MKCILITGGTGFIGINLTKKILLSKKSSKYKIYILTRKKLILLDKDDYKQFAKLSKEYSDLKPLVEKINLLLKLFGELNDLDELLESDDSDMKVEAEKEKDELTLKINELENEIKFLLIPKDESDEKNAISEIRAGTGGEEAALFASDLF